MNMTLKSCTFLLSYLFLSYLFLLSISAHMHVHAATLKIAAIFTSANSIFINILIIN